MDFRSRPNFAVPLKENCIKLFPITKIIREKVNDKPKDLVSLIIA